MITLISRLVLPTISNTETVSYYLDDVRILYELVKYFAVQFTDLAYFLSIVLSSFQEYVDGVVLEEIHTFPDEPVQNESQSYCENEGNHSGGVFNYFKDGQFEDRVASAEVQLDDPLQAKCC